MKIILVESVNHLGRSSDVVSVKPGYARNYLIPRGLAMVANAGNMSVLNDRKSEIDAKEAKKQQEALVLQKVLEALSLELKVETNEEGHLFGTIGVNEVAKLCEDKGHTLNKRDIVLPQGQIAVLGSYPVEVICHVDVTAKLTLNIV